MLGRTKTWGLLAGLLCSSVVANASEPIVQDFDGWKITIRPGVSSRVDDVPPAPAPILQADAATLRESIQLVSLRQQTPPGPAPEGPAPHPVAVEDGFPVITPGDCCGPKTTVSPPEGSVDPRYLSQTYYEIYKSIPFIRAEYDANPSYIHDTAVEFLFGKMRPTVIHRGTTNVNHNYPNGYGMPYGFGGYGGFGGGYMYPPLQLVVPGTGLRVHHLN